MQTIYVKKPFVFSQMVKDERIATETWFKTEGYHEISDEMAAHPFFSRDFAGGKIERPEDTKARLLKAAQIKQESDAEAKIEISKAAAAFARLIASQPETKATAEEIEKDLNTPVGQLQAKRGKEIDQPVTEIKERVLGSKKGG